MRIRTSEATGAVLDWMVAKADDRRPHIEPDIDGIHILVLEGVWVDWFPSTNWTQGGPIIERERITLNYDNIDGIGQSRAYYLRTLFDEDVEGWHQVSPTPLIAAMRCYVASKLGNEVDVPDELIKETK